MSTWAIGALLCAAIPNAVGAGRPNVVLMVADDHGCDLGCYGNPVLKTPNFDSLAREGTLFTHAFCTTASCSASRSVILTGLHNHANAQYGHEHAYHHFRSYEKTKSLPALLKETGYRTARIGKLHVGPEDVYHFEQTFADTGRNTVAMAEKCKEYVSSASEQPFFLYFCVHDPHRSGGPADKPDPFGNNKAYPGVNEAVYSPGEVVVPPFLPDTPECRAELANYYQSVSRVDQGLGRLVQILKDAGKWESTLFIYMSDHGIAFPGGKTTTYEPGLRSPLIVHRPGAKAKGIGSDAMISWVDITPTILDAAKAKTKPNQFHGRSFYSIVDQEKAKGWDEIYASHTFHEITMYYPMRVVRDRRYKLIWNIAHPLPYPFASDLWDSFAWQSVWKKGPDAKYGQRTVRDYIQRPKFELYDLESDPHEVRNLAADPQNAALLASMTDRLKAFQKRTNDPWILKWQYE